MKLFQTTSSKIFFITGSFSAGAAGGAVVSGGFFIALVQVVLAAYCFAQFFSEGT